MHIHMRTSIVFSTMMRVVNITDSRAHFKGDPSQVVIVFNLANDVV